MFAIYIIEIQRQLCYCSNVPTFSTFALKFSIRFMKDYVSLLNHHIFRIYDIIALSRNKWICIKRLFFFFFFSNDFLVNIFVKLFYLFFYLFRCIAHRGILAVWKARNRIRGVNLIGLFYNRSGPVLGGDFKSWKIRTYIRSEVADFSKPPGVARYASFNAKLCKRRISLILSRYSPVVNDISLFMHFNLVTFYHIRVRAL